MGLIGKVIDRVLDKAVARTVQKGQGVPAYWFARALEIGGQENLNEPYKHSAWVQSAIAKIAGPVAAVQVCFYKPSRELAGLKSHKSVRGKTKLFHTSRGKVFKSVEDQIDVPEMDRFLREPVEGLGYGDFVEGSLGWYCMAGEWFWPLPTGSDKPWPDARGGRPLQTFIPRPDHIRHVIEHGELKAWVYRDQEGGKAITFLPGDLIQEKRWNPYSKWRGLAAFESARIAAEADWLAGKMTKNIAADNDAGGMFIIAKNGVPDDAQRQQILDDLRAKRDARQRGDPRDTFLTGDIEVKREEIRSVDTNFVAMRLNSREEVYAALGVPPSLSQVKASYSIGSASDFYQLITTTCIPLGEKFCDALERLTYAVTGEQVECLLDWDDHPVMQEVRKERYASVDTFWSKGVPMAQIDEMLGLEMPDYPGKEIGWMPINVMPAEQAAEAPSNDPALSETAKPQEERNTPNTREEETPAVKNMLSVLKARGDARPTRGAKSKRLWEQHMRARSGTVRLMERKIGKVLSEFRGHALAKLHAAHALTKAVDSGELMVDSPEDGAHGVTRPTTKAVTKSLIDFIFNPKAFGERLMVVMEPVIGAALQGASDDLRKDELGFRDPWKFPPKKALSFIEDRRKDIQGVGGTVRDQLNTQLKEAYDKGESTEDIADRVRGVFNNLSKYEAERIARTETAMAFNFARHESGSAAGCKYKSWLSSHGPNVRPEHEAAEIKYSAEPIPIDEPFHVMGEDLDYPGDPDGSPGNVINCQCIEIMVKPPKDETAEDTEEDED